MASHDTVRSHSAEDALREAAQRMRAIWETVVDGIITIDERGCIESLNPAACRIFGYKPAEVIGQNVSVLMPSPYREHHDGYIANFLRTGEAKIIGIGREVVGQRKDGQKFPMDLAVSEVRLGERRLFTGFVRDISERHALERAVAAAAEGERARIARELHDGLGQQLGGLLFMIKGLHRDLEAAHSPHTALAAQLGDELATALEQARHLAHQLYTVRGGPDGLAQALETLAERASRKSPPTCTFVGDSSTVVHDETVANHLYRIAQEALHNALKHSRATRIEIELSERDHLLGLSVRDDGVGLPETTATSGLGLRTMQQRARLIGGRLVLSTRPEGGTELTCLVPR